MESISLWTASIDLSWALNESASEDTSARSNVPICIISVQSHSSSEKMIFNFWRNKNRHCRWRPLVLRVLAVGIFFLLQLNADKFDSSCNSSDQCALSSWSVRRVLWCEIRYWLPVTCRTTISHQNETSEITSDGEIACFFDLTDLFIIFHFR